MNALAVSRANAGRAPWIATFDPADWESPGFASRVIRQLDESFREGAVGVKIYKTIGMELRSKSGQFLLPDNPVFSPILEAIAKTYPDAPYVGVMGSEVKAVKLRRELLDRGVSAAGVARAQDERYSIAGLAT